jgi:hypothetical protein
MVMMRAIAVVVLALSLISCGTTGVTPTSTVESVPVQTGPQPQSLTNLPNAAPDHAWVWGDRGCCQMTTESGTACYDNTTQNWCESSKPTFANVDWRKDAKCEYVERCAN